MTKHLHRQTGLLILGSQLFPPDSLSAFKGQPIFMSEDWQLCSRFACHQQKLVLFLSAMREYADTLVQVGHTLTYHRLEAVGKEPFEHRLDSFVRAHALGKLAHFEIEDHFFAARIDSFCEQHQIAQQVIESPMFMTKRDQFSDYLGAVKKPSMASFYKHQRQRLGVLVQPDGKPKGGRWSFDSENRKKLPATMRAPEITRPQRTAHTDSVIALVGANFAHHPGDASDFWWPVTRQGALRWLDEFLEQRLRHFGPYQDAISQRSETVFHSLLSPLLNLGLITPADILERTLPYGNSHDIPINSLEGFVRQVIGWREFVRGIYQNYDHQQTSINFWNHHRRLAGSWFTGDTGIAPLDNAIKTAIKLGWTHHIDRLMVIGNLMNLCEIEPRQVHDWFMQMHLDSADWVMGPNVYGMALYSDGGIFATKPYIAGSNYLRKMSDFRQGDWCDIVDGLYWRFVDKHQDFFASNHRLSMTVKTLARIKPPRREAIFNAAERFLAEHTIRA